jgi:Tol biopolymer transport system component
MVNQLTPIPDDADIVFASAFGGDRTDDGHRANELYALSSRTGATTRLTHGRHVHNHFCASPGGRYIATNRILEDTNGNGALDVWDRKHLFVLDLEAGVEHPLVPEFDAGWGGIDWSLDGEWIYLSMSRPDAPGTGADIYRVRPEGTGLDNLTEGIEKTLGPPEATRKFVSDMGVSHDGEWLTFLYHPRVPDESEADRKNCICVSRVDSSEARIVTDGGPLPPGKRGAWNVGDFDPEFSPDGEHLVFSRMTDTGMNGQLSSFDMMRCRVDGSDVRCVSVPSDPAGKGIPDWSADDRIVWMEVDSRDGYVGPVIVNADGTDLRRFPGVRGTHFRWIPGR